MTFLFIFFLGTGILAGAILLNLAASALGVMGWHEFLSNPRSADPISYLWLFVGYPLGLGAIAYGVSKILSL